MLNGVATGAAPILDPGQCCTCPARLAALHLEREDIMRNLFFAATGAALLLAAPAHAEQGDWIVRLRAIMVAPNEKTGPVQPTFATSHTSVSDSYAPEIDFTYMATKHIGAELILATTKHHVSGKDALAPVGRLANTWVLPPTLT